MLRTETSLKGAEGFPWGPVWAKREIVVDSTAFDPLWYEGTVSIHDYEIPGGTVMVPGSGMNGRYFPLQRSNAVSRAYGSETEIVVADASPFRVGDTIRYRDVSDDHSVQSIGVIVDIHYATNTLDIAGNVAGSIAAGDPVEVAYEDADMVILEGTVNVMNRDGTLSSQLAAGIIGGQVTMTELNISGHTWDALIAHELGGMDFIPATPGTGKSPSEVLGNSEIADDAITTAKILDLNVTTGKLAADAVTNAKLADNAVQVENAAAGLTLGAIMPIPATLVNIANNDLLLDGYVPGFAGKILKLSFVTGVVPATTASKDIDLTCMIGATPTTGGLLTLLTAGCNAKGEVTNATAITDANTFTNTDAISLKCVEATAAFAEGSGTFIIVLGTA